MKRVFERYTVAFLFAMAITSCRKDRPEPPLDVPNAPVQHGVYVINEGNFQWANASVSHFDPATGAVVEDLYQPANGEALGDVLQSMTPHGGKAYLVVNNSGKVVVVDPNTFETTGTITGFVSPRHFLPVSASKGYVSDLQSGNISVVDLGANTITATIRCPGWTEAMVHTGDQVFVTNQSRRYVYVIDTSTDALVDSIPVSRGGNSMVQDANGRIWLACTGGGGTVPAIHRIHPETRTVEVTFALATGVDSPWRLVINAEGTVIYYLNNGVYRMDITMDVLPTTPFISGEGRNFYGVGVDPATSEVYVADALDYTQRGLVLRFTSTGDARGNFHAGRIPSGFVFR